MDLALSPEDEAFRTEVRQFLDEHLSEDLREAGRRTGGVFAEMHAGLRWHKVLAARGWSAGLAKGVWRHRLDRDPALHLLAREHGGRRAPHLLDGAAHGRSSDHEVRHARAEGQVSARHRRRRYGVLPRLFRARIGLRRGKPQTCAVPDGDDYVINGTKLWTTGAHVADHMFCLVRTATEGKPQDGISFVLLDSMKTPGLTVQQIVTLAGDHEVNQVFFDNVRTPITNRIGPENGGLDGGQVPARIRARRRCLHPQPSCPHRRRAADSPGGVRRRQRPADRRSQLRRTPGRGRDRHPGAGDDRAAGTLRPQQGQEPRRRFVVDENPRQRDAAVARPSRRRGAWYAAPFEPAARLPGHNEPTVTPDYGVTAMPLYLNNRAATIYAGSNEIQRNIIAKAVLRL